MMLRRVLRTLIRCPPKGYEEPDELDAVLYGILDPAT